MRTILLRWVVGLAVLLFLAAGINEMMQLFQETQQNMEEASSDGASVLDGLTGKAAVDAYLNVKEKAPSFQIPAIRTGVMMYMTQEGHPPQSLLEVVEAGYLSRDVLADPYGNPVDAIIRQDEILLRSAGPDEVRNTTDDVKQTVEF